MNNASSTILEPIATTSWIEKTPGVCGGEACIRATRISVWGLVEWQRLGLSDEQIRQAIEGLSQGDLEAAWQYYENHPDEINAAIHRNASA